ncbi:MAG: 50S ribosomal protein L1 [Rickettsiales bacterium]|jgi:large subunit ribosomal protein L1|nr:50S ribosomal protein L1 [Rickettsiales bacterium]
MVLNKKVEADKTIKANEAIELLKKACQEKQRKFVENVDVAINLTIDPKQTSQNIRGSISLPSGTGKQVKVIVLTEDDSLVKEAKEAGASEAGFTDLVTKIEGGWLGFDYIVATPDSMKKMGKLAKILGPRGLMPNPKNGNITTEVGKVVKEITKGKVNFKNDRFGIVHVGVGKINFTTDDLLANIKAVISALKEAKPEGVKGKYIKDVYLTSTMGPSFIITLDK